MLIPTTNHRNSMRRSSCYNRTSTFPDYILILPDGILDAFEIRRNRTMNGCFANCYMYSCLFLCASKFKWEKKTKTGQMGLWSPGTTLDVVSDVVQMSFRMSFRSPAGFKNLTYCSVTDLSTQRQAVAQHGIRSWHNHRIPNATGLWKLKMAHGGWKWKTKQNIMWFSQTPIYVYVWFGCRFRYRSRCRSPPKWTTLKQFKARIRCGGAANYGPRITEYIAEYYGVFNTAQIAWSL